MKYLAVGIVLASLAGPALAQSVGEKTGVNAALGISPTTADFVKEAAYNDMFEIQSTQLAQQRGNVAEKSFAAAMINDHIKTAGELKEMVGSGAVKTELPATLDSTRQIEIDKLKSLNDAAFSSRYDADQVRGHEDAASLFERYARDGEDAKLKDWAGKVLPIIRHHLEMAESLQAAKTVGRR